MDRELISAARMMLSVAALQRHARMPDAPRKLPSAHRTWKNDDGLDEAMLREEARLATVKPVVESEGKGYSGSKGQMYRPADDPHPLAFVVIQVERAIEDLDWAFRPLECAEDWVGPCESLFRARFVFGLFHARFVFGEKAPGNLPITERELVEEIALRIGRLRKKDRTIVEAAVREWRKESLLQNMRERHSRRIGAQRARRQAARTEAAVPVAEEVVATEEAVAVPPKGAWPFEQHSSDGFDYEAYMLGSQGRSKGEVQTS